MFHKYLLGCANPLSGVAPAKTRRMFLWIDIACNIVSTEYNPLICTRVLLKGPLNGFSILFGSRRQSLNWAPHKRGLRVNKPVRYAPICRNYATDRFVIPLCCVHLCPFRPAQTTTLLGGLSFARFCQQEFGEFPRLVGRYSSFLLPKQAGGTP